MIRKLTLDEWRWQKALRNGWAFSKNDRLIGWRGQNQAYLAWVIRTCWSVYVEFGIPVLPRDCRPVRRKRYFDRERYVFVVSSS